MVSRSTDAPRTPKERVEDAARGLAELARALSKGTEAIRDSSGNVLEMNGSSPVPVLTPQGIDIAVAFTDDGRVSITSEDGLEGRDFRARIINATDSIGTDNNFVAQKNAIVKGLVTAGSLQSDGNINADGSIGAVGNLVAQTNTIATGTAQGGAVRALGNVNANVSVGATSNVVAGNAVIDRLGDVRTASERSIKEHIADLDGGESLDFLGRLRPSRFRFLEDVGAALVPTGDGWRQDHDDPGSDNDGWVHDALATLVPDTTVHVGIYVDEAADADPDSVRTRGDGYRTYEDRAIIARLVSGVTDLRAQVDQLRAEVAELRAAAS